MQGAAPLASPALDRLRHLQSLPSGYQAGGLPSLSPAAPAFSLLFCPLSPRPLPRRGRGRPKVYFAGGSAPGTPALDRLRHLQSLPSRNPQGGAEPRRHWLSLPRGRGPSQTPKFLSPGPPSPWLPALLVENRFLSVLRQTGDAEGTPPSGTCLASSVSAANGLMPGVPGAVAPGEIK